MVVQYILFNQDYINFTSNKELICGSKFPDKIITKTGNKLETHNRK